MFIYRMVENLANRNNEPTYFSPEYIFAQEFTANYDEFGKYISEFARLKELSKITEAIRILSTKKDEVEQKNLHFRQLLDSLPSWEERNSTNHHSNQSDYFDLPLPNASITTAERDFAIFRHNNVKYIKNLLPKNICKRREGNEELARQDFAEAKAQIKQIILDSTQLLEGFYKIGLGASVRDEHDLELEKHCLWVAASVRHHIAGNNSQFVYGGVRVLPRVNSITSTNQNFSRMMGNAFASQNRITVNAATISRVSSFQQAPIGTRFPTGSYQSSVNNAPMMAQATNSSFNTSARASTSSYQSSSSSTSARAQTTNSSSFNTSARTSTSSYQSSSSSAPVRAQTTNSSFNTSARASTRVAINRRW